jgi:hypothetical protein
VTIRAYRGGWKVIVYADPAAMTVDVNGNIVTAKDLPGKYTRKEPKSGHGERLLALDATTVSLLREHRARRDEVAQDFETG